MQRPFPWTAARLDTGSVIDESAVVIGATSPGRSGVVLGAFVRSGAGEDCGEKVCGERSAGLLGGAALMSAPRGMTGLSTFSGNGSHVTRGRSTALVIVGGSGEG